MKPLLLIDVDGPLNPFLAKMPKGFTRHFARPANTERADERKKPLPLWLCPAHGIELQKLPFDLVWATTWESEANVWIGPHIGLPELPVIEFDKEWQLPSRPDGTYFKTHDIVKYAAHRPFAWVDDEIGAQDRSYVARHHHAQALLLTIDARMGLRPDHFATLAAWAADLEEAA